MSLIYNIYVYTYIYIHIYYLHLEICLKKIKEIQIFPLIVLSNSNTSAVNWSF